MTRSAAIALRNRANAQKSTGPRTAQGKARAAGNARRHGATAKPQDDTVLRWLAIILGAPVLSPEDLDLGHTRVCLALELAQAEAVHAQSLGALRRFEAGAEEPSPELLRDHETLDRVHDLLRVGVCDRDIQLLEHRLAAKYHRRLKDETQIGSKRHQLLTRYAREARARRNAAFAAWLATTEETSDH